MGTVTAAGGDPRRRSFGKLDPKPRHRVSYRWSLGFETLLSDKNRFYAQAAANCHDLFHEGGGKLRDRLLQFLEMRDTGGTTIAWAREAMGS